MLATLEILRIQIDGLFRVDRYSIRTCRDIYHENRFLLGSISLDEPILLASRDEKKRKYITKSRVLIYY